MEYPSTEELNEDQHGVEYGGPDQDYERVHLVEKPAVDPKFNPDGVGKTIQIVKLEVGCPNCGYDRARVETHEPPGAGFMYCQACEEKIKDINH